MQNAIDRTGNNVIQYKTQGAIQGTPQGETVSKDSLGDTRFRLQGPERQAMSGCQSWIGQPTCKPIGFSRGYLTEMSKGYLDKVEEFFA